MHTGFFKNEAFLAVRPSSRPNDLDYCLWLKDSEKSGEKYLGETHSVEPVICVPDEDHVAVYLLQMIDDRTKGLRSLLRSMERGGPLREEFRSLLRRCPPINLGYGLVGKADTRDELQSILRKTQQVLR